MCEYIKTYVCMFVCTCVHIKKENVILSLLYFTMKNLMKKDELLRQAYQFPNSNIFSVEIQLLFPSPFPHLAAGV